MGGPSSEPSKRPTSGPTTSPTGSPSDEPTVKPSSQPTITPTVSNVPSRSPVTSTPTESPVTSTPTISPTAADTTKPTSGPTAIPTATPTVSTENPTATPTATPTAPPTSLPTDAPTTAGPTRSPTDEPTTAGPTRSPTDEPTSPPTRECVQDPDAKFNGNDKNGCAWLTYNEGRRQNRCKKLGANGSYIKAQDLCPSSCNPTGNCCVDDETFQFKNDQGVRVSCSWITQNAENTDDRFNSYCEGTNPDIKRRPKQLLKIRGKCMKSCDRCQIKIPFGKYQ